MLTAHFQLRHLVSAEIEEPNKTTRSTALAAWMNRLMKRRCCCCCCNLSRSCSRSWSWSWSCSWSGSSLVQADHDDDGHCNCGCGQSVSLSVSQSVRLTDNPPAKRQSLWPVRSIIQFYGSADLLHAAWGMPLAACRLLFAVALGNCSNVAKQSI